MQDFNSFLESFNNQINTWNQLLRYCEILKLYINNNRGRIPNSVKSDVENIRVSIERIVTSLSRRDPTNGWYFDHKANEKMKQTIPEDDME